jgi:serine/threonine protein kinase
VTSPGYPTSDEPSDQRGPPVKPGEELGGKYRIERVVGAGAMGVVVEARHMELDQQVAIKFLYPEFARNADGAERFRREARAAVKIRNEHVARVIDVGTLAGKNTPYIVMEYLHGRDLARELAERGTLPVQEGVRYILEACEAVAEAHKQGIVHRDLKPANLFLAHDATGERTLKVLDFGISKVNGQGSKQFSLTDTATLMGSPAYMSPEQLESSRNVDGRSDIWSLGVILHELILGSVPFTGESVPQLVRAILAGTRTTLVERDPTLAELERIVARCLRQDRAERFQDIAELCGALRPLLGSSSSEHLAASRAQLTSTQHSGTARGVGGNGSEPNFETEAKAAVSADEGQLGSGGVESGWGHTQQGRRGSLRRGAPLAAVLALLVVGGYWFLRPGLDAPSEAHLGAGVAPLETANAKPSEPQAEVREPDPASTASASAAIAAPPAPLPEPHAVTVPGTLPAAPIKAGEDRPSPQVHMLAPASAVGTVSTEVAAAKTREAARVTPPAQKMTPPASPLPPTRPLDAVAPAAEKPVGESDSNDKPKPEPSRRDGFEIPDFGGRE